MPQSRNHPPDGLTQQMPLVFATSNDPQGALISTESLGEDKIAVVYPQGLQPPRITIEQTAGHVQTVLADGVAVAIVARAHGPGLSAEDVVLIERYV